MTDTADNETEATGFDPDAFARWLAEYPRGNLGYRLSTALAEIIEASQLHGKKSSMSLTIDIAPSDGFNGEMIVRTDVVSKPARPTPPSVTFFPTPTGGLSRRDPNQPQIPGIETQ